MAGDQDKEPDMAMDERQFHQARALFRAKIDSVRKDVNRCFWPIADPAVRDPALFPAVIYCFATVDYFSGFWAGWNKKPPRKTDNQNKRMMGFLNAYLLYPPKEARIAIDFWRHKLMHTSEPRVLRSKPPAKEVYHWCAGIGVRNHMRLENAGEADHYVLGFDCHEFARDLEEGVFGPNGYFADLRKKAALQQKYIDCAKELDEYEIDLSEI
jgi:hypothetical protein